MPNYKEHLLGALFFYVLILAFFSLYYFSWATGLQWLLATLAGGLFPDIDIKSMGQKLFYKLFLCLVITCIIYNKLWYGLGVSLFSFLPLLSKHRGLFHNFWFLAILTYMAAELLSALTPLYSVNIFNTALFFLLGIVSHLWLDGGLKSLFRFR